MSAETAIGVYAFNPTFLKVSLKLKPSRGNEISRPMLPALVSVSVTYLVFRFASQMLLMNSIMCVSIAPARTLLYVAVLNVGSGGREVRDFLNLLRRSAGQTEEQVAL